MLWRCCCVARIHATLSHASCNWISATPTSALLLLPSVCITDWKVLCCGQSFELLTFACDFYASAKQRWWRRYVLRLSGRTSAASVRRFTFMSPEWMEIFWRKSSQPTSADETDGIRLVQRSRSLGQSKMQQRQRHAFIVIVAAKKLDWWYIL